MDHNVLMRLEDLGCTFHVRKSRLRIKAVPALQHVNLELRRGDILGIIGHNGAGKSTLLQVMNRILLPDAGKLYIPKETSIALLQLELGFAQELTGKENAVLGVMYLGHSRREAEQRLSGILEFAEIGAWADEPLRAYSTGMRLRLAFAVALEMAPDIMLIDEVLGVGDAYFQQKSSTALRKKMYSGQATVLVSHDESTLRTLCNRILWLHAGAPCMLGDPNRVLDAYASWVKSLRKDFAGIL